MCFHETSSTGDGPLLNAKDTADVKVGLAVPTQTPVATHNEEQVVPTGKMPDTLIRPNLPEQATMRDRSRISDIKNNVWKQVTPLLEAFARHTLAVPPEADNLTFVYEYSPERQKLVPHLVKPFGDYVGLKMEILDHGKPSASAKKVVGMALQAMADQTVNNDKPLHIFGFDAQKTPKRFPQKWNSVPPSLDYSLNIQVSDDALLSFASQLANITGRTDLYPAVAKAFEEREKQLKAEKAAEFDRVAQAWETGGNGVISIG